MARLVEFLVEVTVSVDPDEVDTPDKLFEKEKQVRRVIESIDPGIGIFEVTSFA